MASPAAVPPSPPSNATPATRRGDDPLSELSITRFPVVRVAIARDSRYRASVISTRRVASAEAKKLPPAITRYAAAPEIASSATASAKAGPYTVTPNTVWSRMKRSASADRCAATAVIGAANPTAQQSAARGRRIQVMTAKSSCGSRA